LLDTADLLAVDVVHRRSAQALQTLHRYLVVHKTPYGRCSIPSSVPGTKVGQRSSRLKNPQFAEFLDERSRQWKDPVMPTYLHTMYRVTDPVQSRAFYEALG